MKSYVEYVLDEECEAIDEGIINYIKNKLNEKKDGKTVVDPTYSETDKEAGKEPKTFNITADYRALKTAVTNLGNALTKGQYEEALKLAKEIKSDNIASSIDALIKGQAKVKELSGKTKNDEKTQDDVDGDELAARAASTKTEKKDKESCFNY